MIYRLKFLLFIAVVSSKVYAQTSEVNVALNKPISANVTCGSPAEFFYAHKEILKPAQNRVRSICDSANSSLAHPPHHAVDEDTSSEENYTWWQSTSRNNLVNLGFISPDTILTIDLQEVYSIQSVSIQMGDSLRPDQMALLRSNDGVTFTPWEYKVTSSQDCLKYIAVFSVDTAVESLESVICNIYSLTAQPRNEIISFEFDVPDVLKEWGDARYIRFEFFNMPRNFGFRADDYYHYTVRNIVAMAPCNCNSHASECTLQPSLTNPDQQNYRCVCQDNTQGANCQECLPFYNQLAYQTGENGFMCQKCNCFNHSEECVFDANIARSNLSLNEFGDFIGGGVCQNCRNHTSGTNCESCERFFFRPSDKSQSDEDACQLCDCHLPGTREDAFLGIQRGECVVNDNEMNLPAMSPGDCFCKTNVIGSRCDQCVPGTYDLNDINPEGCRDCDCFLPGTLNGTNVCNTTTGQCQCKSATTGRQCSQCLAGYYNISAINPNGCSDCACDVGGALSHICDRVSGLCSCRRGITGQRCNSASATTFVPTLHFFSSEFESVDHADWERDESFAGFSSLGYVSLSGTASTTVVLTIPSSQLSGTFEILLRVITQGITRVTLTISPIGDTQGSTVTATADIPLCPTWCFDAQVLNSDPAFGSRFLLAPGSWEIQLETTLQGGARILLDEIVALPVEFENPSSLLGQNTANQFVTTCDVRNNDMRLGTRFEEFCLAQVFSIMTYYLDGTQDCTCDVVGSTSSQCDTNGGQCPCKPGVGGRRCDICLPEFYGFGPAGCVDCWGENAMHQFNSRGFVSVCQNQKFCVIDPGVRVSEITALGRTLYTQYKCSCFGDDKVCDPVTGQCNCPPNTAGRRCDRCVTFSYDLNSTSGCKMCDCNTDGSMNRQCDSVTGQCPCKPGVGLLDCSECLPGFRMFSDEGCDPCNCNLAGSVQPACDQVTGQCQCKGFVQGLTCDECLAGSFYLSESNPEGCLECICMGITDQCDSTTQKYSQIRISPDYVPASLPVNSNQAWVIADTYFSGDLLGLYGSSLHIALSYQSDTPMPISFNISIQGDSTQAIFSTTILEPSTNMSIEIPMQETSWLTQNFETISRSEFFRLLVNVLSIQISGTMSNSPHTSRILDVFSFEATSPSSVLYDPSAPRAFPVEQCLCGDGYEGLSCQNCEVGYYRQNVGVHPFLGTCQPCQCNGHSEVCDVNTGQCLECLHNTAGFNCELCDDGFYGDATMGTETDCQACPCSNLTTTSPSCDVINGMLVCLHCSRGHTGMLCDQCVDFYYGRPDQPGGFCSPCDCNGNSNQCDPLTGMCLGCQFRTEGFNCERCQNFLYGNATQQDCQDCNCQPAGSESLLCDVITGQCPCLSNITGSQCDQCLPNYFSFGNPIGCSPCDCNPLGSIGLQCNNNGSCPCFADAEGLQCDRCMQGSFGLPDARCQSCDCDALGTIGGTNAICDTISGQCPCKVGVTGRSCNQCSAGFVNFTAGSCSKCDRCVDTLLNSTLDIEVSLTNHWTSANMLQQLQERDAALMTLEPQINDSYVQMTSLLEQLTELRGQLEGIHIDNITTMSDDLQGVVTFVANKVQTDLSDSIQELTRVANITDAISLSYQYAEDLKQAADRYIIFASGWNSSAFIMKQEATRLLTEIMNVTVDMSIVVAGRGLTKSQGVLERAEEYRDGINQQADEAAALVEFLDTTRKLIGELAGNITIIEGSLDSTDGDVSQIISLVDQTDIFQTGAEDVITQAENRLAMVTSLMNQTFISLEQANQAFEDSQIVLDGSQQGSPGVPVSMSLDQRGVNGWNEASDAVRNAVMLISQLQTTLPPLVENAESHVQNLEVETLSSNNILSNAVAVSQAAYQAVQMYHNVVSVVNQAQQLATNASSVSQALEDYLNTRDLTALKLEASNLEDESLNLLFQVQTSVPNTEVMEVSLQSANQTVQLAKELWELADGSRQDLESSAEGLQEHVSESSVSDVIMTGHQTANATIELSSLLLNNISQLNASLEASRSTVETLQETVNNGNLLLDGFADRVSSIEASEEEISVKFETLNHLMNQTTQLRSKITEKMAALRLKLAQAQNHLVNSKFPARFEGSSALTLRRESEPEQTLNDEVRLRFRTEQRDGLLFFTENREGKSFMSLEIVASRVVFRFRIADDVVRVQSPIDVCCGEWYSVLATRYANQGELTVTKISTGGSSTDFDRSLNIFLMYMPFQANTTLHIGGIPRNYQFDLALSRDFAGCISDVTFEEEEFDLWQPYSLEGSTSCCEAPQQVEPSVPPNTDGISLDGFGYLQIPQADFDAYNDGSISVEFRTSVKEAVIFSISRPDLISYIGIFLTNGRVVFEFNTAGNAKYTIRSAERYNDADWHKVLVSYNSTNYKMELSYVNGTVQERFDRRTLYSLTFPNLRFSAKIFLGSADPVKQLATIRGPTDLSFAGCLRNLHLSNMTSGALSHVVVTEETAVTHSGVKFTGCLAEVTEGFGFTGDFAFAQLQIPDQLQATRSLQFYFKTEEPHGILAYSYDAQSFNKLFYVALYHGNIFVRYNVGKGLSEPLQTKGEKLNSGQWQLVTIQFTALSVSLKVNNEATIYSSRQLGTDGIQINGPPHSFLYLGGVPASIPELIGGQFPVRDSLSGDMRSFTINNVSPNLNDPEVVIRDKGLRLTDISPAVGELPPLPYPTDSPGQGTPLPQSCQPPVDVVPYPGVIRFGATGDQSYLGFSLRSAERNYFLSSFVIKVQFRAHSADGILYYGSNQANLPSQWFALLLRDGKLSFNMMTSSASTTGLDISTKARYDTGQWYEVLVLRISDFIAILVDETDEYVKGQGATNVNSQIDVQTHLFLGGVSQNILNPYISSTLNGKHFDGCIRMLEVSGNYARDLVLSLSSPNVSKSTELCEQNSVELKTYFTGRGYIKLSDDITVSSGFQVKIDFSTTQQQALLFAVSQNKTTFVALDLFDGGVRAIVDHNTGQPTVVRATSVQEFQLCDGNPHSVSVTVTDSYIEISVDEETADRTTFQARQNLAFSGPLYLGGIPETGEVDLIAGINIASFRGCLTDLVVNEEIQDLEIFIERSGVQKGCPLAIP